MKKFIQSYIDIVFPATCSCCGHSLTNSGSHLCVWCSQSRFEPVGCPLDLILPEQVRFLFSMWHFDKDSYLQDLLHKLKYNHLRGVGIELGSLMGYALQQSNTWNQLFQCQAGCGLPVLVPVPLHPSKKRKRGYNQARALAEGLQSVTGWEITGPSIVERVQKTRTQTGLNSHQRSKNVKGAFKVKKDPAWETAYPIIVDDVFTTGATTFELADSIKTECANDCGILTVALA
ncbi:MAG: ComF family protein [Balneolaceae bacterium]